jgi:hypothetical protein
MSDRHLTRIRQLVALCLLVAAVFMIGLAITGALRETRSVPQLASHKWRGRADAQHSGPPNPLYPTTATHFIPAFTSRQMLSMSEASSWLMLPRRIVSKRLGSRYVSGRSKDWLKFKNPDAPAVKREAEEDWNGRRK